MDINLNSSEITQSLVDYVASQGLDLQDKDVSVTFVAGRGTNGPSAVVGINPAKQTTLADIAEAVPTNTEAIDVEDIGEAEDTGSLFKTD